MTLDLERLEELARKATPGPWEWVIDRWHGGYSGIVGAGNAEVLFPNHCNDGDEGAAWFEDFPSEEDRAFMEALNPATILALIAEVRRLREALEEYACAGLGICTERRLKDGSCIRATDGTCGNPARAALRPQAEHQDGETA